MDRRLNSPIATEIITGGDRRSEEGSDVILTYAFTLILPLLASSVFGIVIVSTPSLY